jgi:diaminopimelate decarboxylase
MIRQVVGDLDVQLIAEPGRLIVGNAGILVSRVTYRKTGEGRIFLIIDAGMNDLIRPALYDAHHDIIPVTEPKSAATSPVDVVGPVCESADLFAKDRALPPLERGDLVAILSAGAYGAVQASDYNTRPLVPEVLVKGDQFAIIRPRPRIEDIIAQDRLPRWLT